MTISPTEGGVPLVSDVATERQRCLGRERTLKALAALLLLFSANGLAMGVLTIVQHYRGAINPEIDKLFSLPWALVGIAWSALLCWGAVLLWRLEAWGRLAIGVWGASLVWGTYNVLTVPVSEAALDAESVSGDVVRNITLTAAAFFSGLAAYLLWLTFARKTKRVLSLEYQTLVVSQTPQFKNGLAGSTKAALFVIGAFIVIGTLQNLYVAFSGAP